MTEKVEPRGRRAPFLWASSSAFRVLIQDLPARQRAGVGWVYTCLAASASDSLDGNHQGFAATSDQVRALTGMSRPTFRKAIQTLEQLGLLEREIRTGTNGTTIGLRYNLLEPGQEGANALPPGGQATGQNSYPPEARAGNRAKKEEEAPPVSPRTKDEFEAWLAHHEQVTEHPRPKGRVALRKLLESFGARRVEGWSLDDLRRATVGAHGDEYRRENGYDVPESILRPTKVAGLVAKGKLREVSNGHVAYDDQALAWQREAQANEERMAAEYERARLARTDGR